MDVLVIVGKKFTIRIEINLQKADDLALYAYLTWLQDGILNALG